MYVSLLARLISEIFTQQPGRNGMIKVTFVHGGREIRSDELCLEDAIKLALSFRHGSQALNPTRLKRVFPILIIEHEPFSLEFSGNNRDEVIILAKVCLYDQLIMTGEPYDGAITIDVSYRAIEDILWSIGIKMMHVKKSDSLRNRLAIMFGFGIDEQDITWAVKRNVGFLVPIDEFSALCQLGKYANSLEQVSTEFGYQVWAV